VKVLGLVPARAGSKGVPGKNAKPLLGKPLLQWTVEAAVESGVLDRVVISTEDEGLAALAVEAGAEAPFLRPGTLADDRTPMIDVVLDALSRLDATGYRPDAVALLQPTSPLRRAQHVRAAVGALTEDADSVCTVVPVPLELSPHYVMRLDRDGRLQHFLDDGAQYTRRQDVPRAYRRDGTVYLTRRSVLIDQRSFYGTACVPLVLPPAESVTIDTPEDWAEAERRLVAMRQQDAG
jgi:N-acylneuraminate cytidylyltransferase